MNLAALPDLYWISGSPPSWRVMLALTLKGLPYASRRLDAARKENRTPAYLRINPTGQVPTLVHGRVTVRESIAILAYLDRAWPDRPIFGATPGEAAEIWQCVMEFENRLAPDAANVARALFRGTSRQDAGSFGTATEHLLSGLDDIDMGLAGHRYLTGPNPSAADIWLYPLLGWIDRALDTTTDPLPGALARWSDDRPNLAAWRARFGQIPGVDATTPPHWRATHAEKP